MTYANVGQVKNTKTAVVKTNSNKVERQGLSTFFCNINLHVF